MTDDNLDWLWNKTLKVTTIVVMISLIAVSIFVIFLAVKEILKMFGV